MELQRNVVNNLMVYLNIFCGILKQDKQKSPIQ